MEAARSGWNAQAAPGEGWTRVSLPDTWTTRWPDFDGVVWYRLTFDGACARGRPLAVWADYVNMAGALFLNGELLQRDAHLTEPLSRAWNTPRYLLLPASLLRPHANTLLVRVSGLSAYQPGLGRVAVGEPSAVLPLHENARQIRDAWQWFSLATTIALSGFFFMIWLMRRKEHAYGWFSLYCFAWTCVVVNQIATSVWPFPSTDAWEAANSIALIIFGASFAMFSLSIAGQRAPRVVAALWTFAACQIVVMSLAAGFASQRSIAEVRAIITAIAVATVVVCSLWFIGLALTNRRGVHRVIATCMAFFIAFAIHDVLVFLQVLTSNIYYGALTAHFTAIAMALVLAWRFADSLRRIEGFNDELTAKVAAAQAELGQTLSRQHELEVANVRLGERLALAGDLHDGLGSTLMNNIVALERGPRDESAERFFAVLCELRDELQDIVETVASDPSEPLPLTEMVAPLRHRMAQLFEARGAHVRWSLPDAGEARLTDTRVCADVMRLLQEALTNALRHSGATAVDVALAASGATLRLAICDNGHGFEPAAVSVGLGLRSMRARAERLGGAFSIQSSSAGTELRIALPGVVREPAAPDPCPLPLLVRS